MSADTLLSRLDTARRAGHGWSARCPAHEDRTASLSIAEGDDGRTLVHCFAGCHVADVLGAVGLSLADLFERPLRHHATPQERRELSQRARESEWAAALRVLAREAAVVEVAGHAIIEGARLSNDDLGRLRVALERVQSARAVLA